MGQKIIYKGPANYQQPPTGGQVVTGSSQDMYPEMTAIDLREWFDRIMQGDFEEAGIGRPVIYRKLSNTKCQCFDANQGSPDPNCVYCNGEGYLFTEQQKLVYISKNFGSVLGSSTQISQQSQLAPFGVVDADKALAFMYWYDIPDYERYGIPTRPAPDKLFELKVAPEGNLYYPITRTESWRVRSATPHQGIYGRVEYFELGLEKVSV
jgi:hypothetical protein